MKILSTAILALTYSATLWANEGSTFILTNPGDAIWCESSPENSYSGYYALDYLVLNHLGEFAPVEAQSWQHSLQRIKGMLTQSIDPMANSLGEFIKFGFNTQDYSSPRVWQVAPFALADSDIGEFISLPPQNCMKDGKIQKIRAVIRQRPEFSGLALWQTLYTFVPEVTQKLESTSPVQLSLLMLHEFLWDFTDNIQVNRRVNMFLHSKEAANMSKSAVLQRLIDLGLTLPEIEPEQVKSCNDKELMPLNSIFKLQKQLLEGTVTMPSNLYIRNKTCHPVNGCERSWTETTNSIVENRHSTLQKIVSIMDTQQNISKLAFSYDNLDMICHYDPSLMSQTNLKKCTAIPIIDGHPLWWNNNGYQFGDISFEGKLTKGGLLCLNSQTYLPDGQLWQLYQIYLNSEFAFE